LFEHALSQPVIGLDSRHEPWQMWCITAPGIVFTVFAMTRVPRRSWHSSEIRSVIVCDALKTHEAGARDAGAASSN
jgi:hypothetical protein